MYARGLRNWTARMLGTGRGVDRFLAQTVVAAGADPGQIKKFRLRKQLFKLVTQSRRLLDRAILQKGAMNEMGPDWRLVKRQQRSDAASKTRR